MKIRQLVARCVGIWSPAASESVLIWYNLVLIDLIAPLYTFRLYLVGTFYILHLPLYNSLWLSKEIRLSSWSLSALSEQYMCSKIKPLTINTLLYQDKTISGTLYRYLIASYNWISLNMIQLGVDWSDKVSLYTFLAKLSGKIAY